MHEQSTHPYETLAIATAASSTAIFGILPSFLVSLAHLPFAFLSLALLVGAIVAHSLGHTARFWLFVVMATVVNLGGF